MDSQIKIEQFGSAKYAHILIFETGPDRRLRQDEGSFTLADFKSREAKFTYNDGDVEWFSGIVEVRVEYFVEEGEAKTRSWKM